MEDFGKSLAEYHAEEDSQREAYLDQFTGDAAPPEPEEEPRMHEFVEALTPECPGCGEPWDDQDWKKADGPPTRGYCRSCDWEQEVG